MYRHLGSTLTPAGIQCNC